MAQRNAPANRVPDNPLAGVLRALNQQARYSDRRRVGVPTITSQDTVATADASGGTASATITGSGATVVTTDGTGRATVAFGPYASVPSIVATVYRTTPAVAVVETATATSVTIRVFDMASAPVAAVQVGVYYQSQ